MISGKWPRPVQELYDRGNITSFKHQRMMVFKMLSLTTYDSTEKLLCDAGGMANEWYLVIKVLFDKYVLGRPVIAILKEFDNQIEQLV